MKNFVQLCIYSENQLGRELEEAEVNFLRWLRKRQKEEIQKREEETKLCLVK